MAHAIAKVLVDSPPASLRDGGVIREGYNEELDELRSISTRGKEWIAGIEGEGGDYFGPPVNCAARIMSAAWGGQILLTPEVSSVSPLPPRATLEDLGQHLLKKECDFFHKVNASGRSWRPASAAVKLSVIAPTVRT